MLVIMAGVQEQDSAIQQWKDSQHHSQKIVCIRSFMNFGQKSPTLPYIMHTMVPNTELPIGPSLSLQFHPSSHHR